MHKPRPEVADEGPFPSCGAEGHDIEEWMTVPPIHTFFLIALCSFPGDFRLAFVTTLYSRCINEETEVCRGGVSELSTIHVSEGQGRKPAQAQSGARCLHVPRTPPPPRPRLLLSHVLFRQLLQIPNGLPIGCRKKQESAGFYCKGPDSPCFRLLQTTVVVPTFRLTLSVQPASSCRPFMSK